MIWLAQGHPLSHWEKNYDDKPQIGSEVSAFSVRLTASFLILQSVRAQNLSQKHHLNVVVTIRTAVSWFSRCGPRIPGWESAKSRLFLWRCHLSRSPCCHLHRGGKWGWKSQGETTRRPPECPVQWLLVCVSDTEAPPAQRLQPLREPLGGFLQPCMVTCPVSQQQEHGFTRGLVWEWLWQPYSQPQLRNHPDPPVERRAGA